MLLGGLLIRLPFLCVDPRVSADLELMRGWARIIAEHGIANIAAHARAPPVRHTAAAVVVRRELR